MDDHKVVRKGLKGLLEDGPDLRIIGKAADGTEGIDYIVISDLLMKGLNGIGVVRELLKRSHQAKTIILSMYDDFGYVTRAIQEGAKGYVLKGSRTDKLIAAIQQVIAGGCCLSLELRPH